MSEDKTPKSDPIEIWQIHKDQKGKIVSLITRGGTKYTKEEIAQTILKGGVVLVGSEDGDNSQIDVIGSSDHTLRTVKDDTELNNLSGNTNLKVYTVDDQGKVIE